MSNVVQIRDVAELWETYRAISQAYATMPVPSLGKHVEAAYRDFYFAFNGGSLNGYAESLQELRRNMRAARVRATA